MTSDKIHMINILVAYEDDFIREKCAGIISRLDFVSSVLQVRNPWIIEKVLDRYCPYMIITDSTFFFRDGFLGTIRKIQQQNPTLKIAVLVEESLSLFPTHIEEESGLDFVAMKDIISHVDQNYRNEKILLKTSV